MQCLAALLIGLIPFQKVKIWLYRLVLGYDIAWTCSVGFSLITGRRVKMAPGSAIGHLNVFYQVGSLILQENSVVGARNLVKCLLSFEMAEGSSIANGNRFHKESAISDKGSFFLGKYSRITGRHFFDLTDDITIGENTVIGGLNSQLWTHGFDIYRNGARAPIVIKDNCYLASSVLISLGVTIESENQIGLGAVVAKSIVLRGGFWVSNRLERKKDCEDLSKDADYIFDNNVPVNRFYIKADKRE